MKKQARSITDGSYVRLVPKTGRLDGLSKYRRKAKLTHLSAGSRTELLDILAEIIAYDIAQRHSHDVRGVS